jgi:hypothetical protein
MGASMKSLLRLTSLLAVPLVWTFLAMWIVRILISLYERYFLNRISSREGIYEGPWWPSWLLAAALVLGCATAWRIARVVPIDAEARAQRSALSVWPGWPLAIVGIIAAVATLMLLGVAPGRLQVLVIQSLDNYTLTTVPLTLAAAAAATGGRGKGATALLAGPMTMLLAVGLLAELSIVRLAVAACVPAAVLAIGFAVLASITGREPLVRLAIGFASVVALALLLAPGLFTPTELLGVVSLLAIPIGLLVHSLIEGAFPWRVFVVGATEILAASTAFVFAALAAVLPRVYGVVPEPLAGLPAWGPEVIAVVAMLIGSFVLTPMLTFSVLAIVMFPMLGQANVRVGILLVLAGVAAMILRSIDWTPAAEGTAPLRLPRVIGLVAVTILAAVAALTQAFWPPIEDLLTMFLG